MLKNCFQGLVWLSVAFFFLWAAGAIYYLLWLPEWMRPVCCASFVIGFSAWIWRSKHRHKTRAILAASIVVIYLLTLLIRPSNDRNWADDQSRVAKVEIDAQPQSFEQIKGNARIDVRARQLGISEDFSTKIRLQ